MSTIAYLNGQFLPLEEARVPVLDRGYLFGDGVYEVIPCYAGKPFRFPAHWRRLQQSMSSIRIAANLDEASCAAIVGRLLELNQHLGTELAIYLQVTRGVAGKRAHGLPKDCDPTILAFVWPLPGVSDDIRKHGVSAVTETDYRWRRCDIKSIALLANVMLADTALSNGHNENILHRDNIVTEGASSNVFAIIDGQAFTPPCSDDILEGVTRNFVIELLSLAGLECTEANFSLNQLRQAEEIWITSSTRELYPVTRLDGAPVGQGKPGTYWQQVFKLFQQHKLS